MSYCFRQSSVEAVTTQVGPAKVGAMARRWTTYATVCAVIASVLLRGRGGLAPFGRILASCD
jgi:hypothetical protein